MTFKVGDVLQVVISLEGSDLVEGDIVRVVCDQYAYGYIAVQRVRDGKMFSSLRSSRFKKSTYVKSTKKFYPTRQDYLEFEDFLVKSPSPT
jgi:beta-lactam-binding protein with PASTA domain